MRFHVVFPRISYQILSNKQLIQYLGGENQFLLLYNNCLEWLAILKVYVAYLYTSFFKVEKYGGKYVVFIA